MVLIDIGNVKIPFGMYLLEVNGKVMHLMMLLVKGLSCTSLLCMLVTYLYLTN